MDARTRTLKDLFNTDIQYEVPPFQRPYVWDQESQWEPLWEDVSTTAESLLERMVDFEELPAAQAAAHPHFLGAVVVKQVPTATADVDKRELIDGQQRMTTLQLLTHDTVTAMARLGLESRLLTKLVRNRDADATDAFKVWPTTGDREHFAMVMNGQRDEAPDSRIADAHEYFEAQAHQWLLNGEAGTGPEDRAQALEATLGGLLQLVVIDLGDSDDAFVIFETMNARGTPLLPSDLAKNFLLRTANEQGLDEHELHDRYWSYFETDWWRDEVRQGRLRRPRIDVFLFYWLLARTKGEVRSTHVFPAFQEYARSQKPFEVAADLNRLGQEYEDLLIGEGPEWLQTFRYRWGVLDAGAFTPLLIYVMSEPESRLGPGGLERIFTSLESYVVRRMLGRRSTKGYSNLTIDTIKLLEATADPIDDALIEYLASQTSAATEWPSDAMVREDLATLGIYRLLTRGRVRLVLEVAEDALRSPKTEERCPRNLQIEHILPQSWGAHWPVPAGDQEAADRRDAALHTIGNLTLVTKRLNPALSNSPQPDKWRALEEHSVLKLNRELLNTWPERWDEEAIAGRGRRIADRIIAEWPRPVT